MNRLCTIKQLTLKKKIFLSYKNKFYILISYNNLVEILNIPQIVVKFLPSSKFNLHIMIWKLMIII